MMETPQEIIARAIATYSPAYIFGMYSGGDDSLTAAHFGLSQLGAQVTGVLHLNTGIRVIENAGYVPSVCDLLGWKLLEYRAKDQGQDYEALVLEFGFPGPMHHTKMYNRLKERCIRAMERDHPDGPIVLISGLRSQESGRRMRLKPEPIQCDGRRLWVAPFFHWTNDQVREYRQRVLPHVPINPVREALCMSGECLCGAYAHPGDHAEIRAFFPQTGAYLDDLAARVNARGFPWGWDEEPPEWWVRMKAAERIGQQDAFGDEFDTAVEMACSSCQYRREARADTSPPVITVKAPEPAPATEQKELFAGD